ncbi:MAG: hypothetical protein LBN21_08515 [Treponema sp.]|jgi:hypothetical protein|nr:hypothetical protein [Treponema sp.]
MVEGTIIDTLNLKSRDFAVKWKNAIRKASQLKHYNALDDDTLIRADAPFYPLLARTLDRGIDRSLIGDFFVKLGKDRMRDGYPVSEVIYAINLSQQIVIEYLLSEYAPENAMQMYQTMGVVPKVAEFFLLGSFYLTKGFLEATYTTMSSNDKVSEEFLKKYFKDDFFFK